MKEAATLTSKYLSATKNEEIASKIDFRLLSRSSHVERTIQAYHAAARHYARMAEMTAVCSGEGSDALRFDLKVAEERLADCKNKLTREIAGSDALSALCASLRQLADEHSD